jgi:hypothetical protein
LPQTCSSALWFNLRKEAFLELALNIVKINKLKMTSCPGGSRLLEPLWHTVETSNRGEIYAAYCGLHQTSA